jgi:predicted DNA binding protein
MEFVTVSKCRKEIPKLDNLLDKQFNDDTKIILRKIDPVVEEEIKAINKETKREAEKKGKETDKKKRNIVYYYSVRSIVNQPYIFTPSSTKIVRVPEYVIGQGVLGVAFPGLNYIMVLDSLHGTDFEEVKKHEVNHILFPNLTEYEIMRRTKAEFPFPTRYH